MYDCPLCSKYLLIIYIFQDYPLAMKKIVIGITIGDPAGIGPEIAAKYALNQPNNVDTVFIGYKFVLEDAFKNILKTSMPDINIVEPDERMLFDIEYGKIKGEYGKASMLFIEKAVRMAQTGEIYAVVTCPINKKSIQLGGYDFPGHTEFLGHLTNTKDFSMLLVGDKVRTLLATTHVPMKKLAGKIDIQTVLTAIENANNAGQFFCKGKPKIAVLGLNPHAGDFGALGDEEQAVISPAIEQAQSNGIDASGPYPADSLFPKVLKGAYDFVVCMYHDQGMIPVKMESFGNAVNVTLNLPIIRTSVDHGTAFDIAGKNLASPSSLIRATEVAKEMVNNARSS
jgi:4-hydroxythreonine-4-phosphate dehydrogenase